MDCKCKGCTTRDEPQYYELQSSYRMTSKSVPHFLGTERKKEKEKERERHLLLWKVNKISVGRDEEAPHIFITVIM